MDWLYYLLEANLYLLLFYGFYRIALAKTTFYTSNRYYLVISSITAFLLPIVQLGFLNPKPIIDDILFPPPIVYPGDQLANMNFAPIQETFSVAYFLYPIYLIIALGFAIKMGFGLYKITILWLKAKKLQSGSITIVELDGEKSAFSFFNLLFIHPHLADKQAILTHEMVHIKQKHSLDILFFEILQIICWFNPIIYFIQTDIKLLHEYIADELSVDSEQEKHEYAMFLIENSFGIIPQRLTNQIFNQSILKRRINMLNKKRTAGWARLRLLLALPLVGGMLCASTMAFTKDYGYLDLLPEKSKNEKVTAIVLPQEKKNFSPKYEYDKDNHYISLEKRLIVINGEKVIDNNKYYGSADADKVSYLNSTESIQKYGNEIGKFGAVEITGKNAVSKYPPPIVKRDQVKFPPPAISSQKYYFPNYIKSKTDGEIRSLEVRYIVINGKPIDKKHRFFGVSNTNSVTFIQPDAAKKKYGKLALFGAIEITGKDVKYLTEPAVEPPPPTQDQVKFPPPIGTLAKNFFPNYQTGKNKQYISREKRAIFVNGVEITDKNNFYGVTNADTIRNLNPVEAIAKYGSVKGKLGAVEIIGQKTKFITIKPDNIKFPPPIVKPDGKNLTTAQPIGPPPPPKQDKIKFPPPIVKPIQKSKKRPLAVKPPAPKQDKVKFTPPVLKQDKNNTKDQSSDKLKIQEQVKINQRFLIERLKDQAKNKNAQKLMIEKQQVEAINEMNRQINLAKEKREEEKLRKKLNG